MGKEEEIFPYQLLDLIPKDRESHVMINRVVGDGRSQRPPPPPPPEEKKLELRLGLGPPGGEDWTISKSRFTERDKDYSLLSLGYFSPQNTNNISSGAKRGFDRKTIEEDCRIKNHGGCQIPKFSSSSSLELENPPALTVLSSSPWSSSHYQQSLPVVKGKESSQVYCSKEVLVVDLHNAEKKAYFSASANTAVPNSSQKRSAAAPVVGWPPIRSFRKNIASSTCSSKQPPQTENVEIAASKNQVQKSSAPNKGLFVKINMDGVPIGRKVDLKSYNSYENLSCAVDQLFSGLLAAQMDCSSSVSEQVEKREKVITGLLDGSGEYTLVYEDNEGDRMLVGDVPWNMFLSAVKRLRVLKSSDLSSLIFGSIEEKQQQLDAALKN